MAEEERAVKHASVLIRPCAAVALVSLTPNANAQFAPPAGYSGDGALPGVAVPTDPQAPTLIRIPDATMSSRFKVDPNYRRGASKGYAKVVGAFAIAETPNRRFVAAWAPGFLPITISFSNGQCYSLEAAYEGGTLSNGRMREVECDKPPDAVRKTPPAPPTGSLKLIGTSWSHAAWLDDRAGITLVTGPDDKTFQPLFTARMEASAIMAMDGPDFPGGDVTLVGRVGGRLTMVTLEVGY